MSIPRPVKSISPCFKEFLADQRGLARTEDPRQGRRDAHLHRSYPERHGPNRLGNDDDGIAKARDANRGTRGAETVTPDSPSSSGPSIPTR